MESIEAINGQHYSTHCISHSLDNLWIQIDFQFRRRQTNLCDICCCLFLSFFIYLFIDRLVDARCRCVNFQTKTSLDLRHLVGVERKSSPPHTLTELSCRCDHCAKALWSDQLLPIGSSCRLLLFFFPLVYDALFIEFLFVNNID